MESRANLQDAESFSKQAQVDCVQVVKRKETKPEVEANQPEVVIVASVIRIQDESDKLAVFPYIS